MHRHSVAIVLTGLVVVSTVPLFFSTPADAVADPAFVTYTGPGAIGPIEENFGEGTLPVGQPIGSEPSLGVSPLSGDIFYQLGEETYRITFDDVAGTATWNDVTPPASRFNLDPILWTDSETGRTFAGGLDGTCSALSYTDDDGASWTPAGNACVATLDHPSIVSGPWRNGIQPAQATYGRAVYYCGQDNVVTCVVSFDGGLTFAPAGGGGIVTVGTNTIGAGPVSCAGQTPGLHGSLHVDSKGRVFLPFRNCGGRTGMAYSLNNGLGWAYSQVGSPTAARPADGFDPDIGTGSSRVYIGFQGEDNHPYVAVNQTDSLTWRVPVDVGASAGITAATMPEVVVGDDDRVAMAFYGTKDSGNPFAAAFTGDWYLFVATSYDAGATWAVYQATADPVQRGWICADGIGCTEHRNLLDFMDATLDEKGNVLVAYTDGCTGACALPTGTPASSNGAAAGLARQVGGRPLYAAYDPVLDVLANGPYEGTGGAPTTIGATATGGTGPYTYAWTLMSAPEGSTAGAASFGSTSAASTTFTPDAAGEYVLRVIVGDSAGHTDSDVAVLSAAGGTGPTPPILTDEDGDVVFLVLTGEGVETFVPGTDILEARVLAETADDFTLELRVDNLGSARPTALNTANGEVGLNTIYSLGFLYDERPGNVVSYAVSASRFAQTLDGAPDTIFTLGTRGTGATQFTTTLDEVVGLWDEANERIVWTVPKALMTVRTAPTGAADPGDLVTGNVPTNGDMIHDFDASVRTWVTTPVVGFGPGVTSWDDATSGGSYTFGGVPSLGVAAGGPYAGLTGAAIPIAASASGGSAPYTYAWSIASKPAGSSATSANFGSATSDATTFTPDIAGSYVLEITVTDAAADTVTATATLIASATGGGSGTLIATGTIIAGGPHTLTTSLTRLPVVSLAGIDSFRFNAPTPGTSVTTVTTDNGGLGYDLDIYFFDAAGTQLLACSSEAIDEVCEVPSGATRGEIAAFTGVQLDVEVYLV